MKPKDTPPLKIGTIGEQAEFHAIAGEKDRVTYSMKKDKRMITLLLGVRSIKESMITPTDIEGMLMSIGYISENRLAAHISPESAAQTFDEAMANINKQKRKETSSLILVNK